MTFDEELDEMIGATTIKNDGTKTPEELLKETNDESTQEKETNDAGNEGDGTQGNENEKEGLQEKEVVQENKEEVKETPKFSVDLLNDFLGDKLENKPKNEEELIKYFDKASKYDEVSGQLSELSAKYEEAIEAAKKASNPLEFFANKDEYIRQQFLLKNKDKYDEQTLSHLTSLSPDKIKSLDGWNALKFEILVNNPELNGDAAGVEELLRDRYGVSDMDGELDGLTKTKITIAGSEAKKNLMKLYDGIDIPEAKEWESQRESLKTAWEPVAEATVKGIKDIQIADGLSFTVSDDMKDGLLEEAMHDLIMNGSQVSEEATGELAGLVRTKIRDRYWDKIVESIQKDTEEKVKAQYREELHNDKEVGTHTKIDATTEKGLNEQALEHALK